MFRVLRKHDVGRGKLTEGKEEPLYAKGIQDRMRSIFPHPKS